MNRRSSQRIAIGALAVFLGLVGLVPTATATSAESEECALSGAILGRFGGYRIRSYDTDSLRQGEAMRYNVTLAGGNDYVVFACGDGRVEDLDLAVYDGAGNLIANDVQTDALPIVEVTVRRSSHAVIRVNMYDTVGPRAAWYTVVILYR